MEIRRRMSRNKEHNFFLLNNLVFEILPILNLTVISFSLSVVHNKSSHQTLRAYTHTPLTCSMQTSNGSLTDSMLLFTAKAWNNHRHVYARPYFDNRTDF